MADAAHPGRGGVDADHAQVGVDEVVIQVNSKAAVPTTSTSITMPFRKNLGFN